MSFSFVEIESKKDKSVKFIFISLVIFYFIGALLLYASFYRGDIFNNPVRIFAVLGGSLVIAILHWVTSTSNMLLKIMSAIGARHLDADDRYHRVYKNIVDEVSVALGGRQIEPYVVNSHYLNAFAVTDFKGRSIVGVTEGLLVKLSRRQLEAVVAHEASHIAWNDSLIATVGSSITSIFRILYGSKVSGRSIIPRYADRRLGSGFIIVKIIAGVMWLLTLLLNMWISREREFRADSTAVRITRDPLSLAEALQLIARGWRGAHTRADDYQQIFIVNPMHSALEQSNGIFADLFSTHPPVKQRIEILLNMAHADVSSFQSSIKEKVYLEDDTPISVPVEKPVWFGSSNGIWQGPFLPADLIRQEWFKPDCWIKKDGVEAVKPAYEYNELNLLLKNKNTTSTGSLDCPFCRQPLDKLYYEGITINKCQSCKGVLVAGDKIPRIMARRVSTFSDEVKKLANLILESQPVKGYGKYYVKSQAICPQCGVNMLKKPYNSLYPRVLEVDECAKCGLIWFDRNELEAVQYITEQNP